MGYLGHIKTLHRRCVSATGALSGCLGASKTLHRCSVSAAVALSGRLGATQTMHRRCVSATGTFSGCLGPAKTLHRRGVSATGPQGRLRAASEPLKRWTGVVFRPGALAGLTSLKRWTGVVFPPQVRCWAASERLMRSTQGRLWAALEPLKSLTGVVFRPQGRLRAASEPLKRTRSRATSFARTHATGSGCAPSKFKLLISNPLESCMLTLGSR